MRLLDNYGSGKFGLSIEIFPPKTPAGDVALFESLDRLTGFQPGFISCTYGAGGSTSKHCRSSPRRPIAGCNVMNSPEPAATEPVTSCRH